MFFSKNKKQDKASVQWSQLKDADQLEGLVKLSEANKVLIFKHSTRCSISGTSLSRLEKNWDENEMGNITPFLIDVISHRDISLKTEQMFGIQHESPQLLIIDQGKCVYNASHMGISYKEIKNLVG